MAMNLTWGHDWVHLPGLWRHYQEHRVEQQELSFLGFIALHYGDRHHRDNDRTHQELPFQHHKDHGGIDHAICAPLKALGALPPPPARADGLQQGLKPLEGFRCRTLQPPRA